MSALPRADVAPGPARSLNDALHDLHHRAGWPSLRTLARETGVSHTTVSKVFSSPTLPSWGTLELLVEAMDGDAEGFRDLWLTATAPVDGGPRPVPRIAGRRAELDVVRRHLETGTGLLLVTGEAGMGKTRLITAATDSVDTFVAIGHCLPLSTEVPLMPVADVLRSIYESDDGQWFKQALTECPRYVTGSLARLLPDIGDLSRFADPDDDWSRHRLFTAIAEALEALVADRPLAVVLEDLHWADPMTMDVLEHLDARGCGWPTVGAWRIEPEARAGAAAWWDRVRRSAGTTVLPLAPLSHKETTDQLRLLMGSVDRETVDRIHARSLGQPLFTEQLAAHGATSEPELPELLADLLDRRFEHLPRAAWVIARTLGVADRGLPVDVLRACVDLDSDELTAALHQLDARMLLASLRADVVQLRHPLLAAAVRHRLVSVESTEVHRLIAVALGAHDAPAAEVAGHWQAAGSSGKELEWRVKAARTADERFAGEEAANHWKRVLDLWPAGETSIGLPPMTRAQVLWAAMDGVDMSGRPTEGMALAQRALAEAAEWPEADRAETLRRSANYADTLVHVGAGKDLTAEALSIYRRLPAREELVYALAHHAFVLNQFGRTDEAAAVLEEARLAIERLGPTPLIRGHLASMADQEARSGRLTEARAWISEISRVETDTPEPLRDIWVDVNHTDILLLACASADEVAAAGRRGLDAGATWGLETMELNVLRYNVAAAWLRAGRIGRASELIDPFTDAAFTPNYWLLYLMRAALDGLRGRSDEARLRLAVLSSREGVDIGLLETEQAVFELWHGEPGEALRAISDACEVETGATVPGDTGVPLVLAARAAAELAGSAPVDVHLRRELRARLDTIREAAGHNPFSKMALPSDRCAAPQWAAELARLEGADTVDHWTHAATTWDLITRPHDAAYCRWRGAQVALREGQGTTAARLLKRAAADAREHVPLSEAIARTGASG